ncbi:carbohydrate ABC transporter permease [Paenibacillus doosanensis]|uniref:Lactose transport system permease protein LacG n=1 Tax=Paenibacillus konkukensis TaxID=2020716 RepID=A0ABY4RJJ6_9BACL|nr:MULTISPECIES: carbohydrate ABC transporter permease [Paenibacillus]MCS7460617.1 carbohydrate ABC transporter permease [Paenibacillus doosanensis]UQZ82596.1 Lactose transport system permease protein LacG [Paenibacillus konkukensis]
MDKPTLGEKSFDVLNAAVMIVLCFLTLYPFLYVAFSSLSDPGLLAQHRGLLWKPYGFSLDAYKAVFANPNILSGYSNTIFYVVVGTFFNLLMTALGAYFLSRRNVFFKNAVMFMIVVTMFFQGGLIPTYLLVSNLGLVDTPWAMIIPGAINTWNLIIMRTSFQAVPVSLEESAKMDGASEWTVMWRIILPLSIPVMAVMVLFYAVAHWNAWFNAMIYLRDRNLYPLQLILREILITNSTDNMMTDASGVDKMPIGEAIKYATIMVATIPILVLYPFLQKYFVKGVMIGALKE